MCAEVWGHLARNCPTPNPKGGGKGEKAGGGKGGNAGGPKGGGKALGKGLRNSNLLCVTCGKTGHLKDRCWVTYPELQRKKKRVQGVEGEQGEVPMDSIRIGAIDICDVCDTLPLCDTLPCWTTINRKGLVQTTAACSDNLSVVGALMGTDNKSVVGVCEKPRGPNMLKVLQADDNGEEDLYAEKTREQLEFRNPEGSRHASLASSPSPCIATNEGPCRMTVGAAASYKKDRVDEISSEMKSNAAPEHKADHESIYAAPKHQADRESMSRHGGKGEFAPGGKGEFVPGQFVPLVPPFLPSTFSTSPKEIDRGNVSKGAEGEMPYVGAEGFASDEELYAEKARKQLEAKIGKKQLGPKENAARFRPDSADERSSASTLDVRIMSRNCAKKLRQREKQEEESRRNCYSYYYWECYYPWECHRSINWYWKGSRYYGRSPCCN